MMSDKNCPSPLFCALERRYSCCVSGMCTLNSLFLTRVYLVGLNGVMGRVLSVVCMDTKTKHKKRRLLTQMGQRAVNGCQSKCGGLWATHPSRTIMAF